MGDGIRRRVRGYKRIGDEYKGIRGWVRVWEDE